MIEGASASFLSRALGLSRANPVLGTAFALGAHERNESLGQATGVAYTNTALGIALCKWGYFVEAEPLLTDAIQNSSSRDSADVQLYAQWHQLLCERRIYPMSQAFERLLEIGNRLEATGDTFRAEQCRQDAVSSYIFPSPDGAPERILEATQLYFATHTHKSDWAIGLILLSYLYLNQGDFEQTRSVLQEAEALFMSEKMPTLLALVWQQWGYCYWKQHKTAEAKQVLKRARRYAAGLKHEFYLSQCLFTEFALYFETGSIEACRGLLTLLRELPSAQALNFVRGGTETAAGGIALRSGHYDEAETAYQHAEQAYREADQTLLVASSRMNLGVVARRKGDFGGSLRLLNEALQAFEAKDCEYQARAHHNIAKTYATFGYFEPAIKHARLAIMILKAGGLGYQIVKPAIYLARLLAERDQIPEALQSLDGALKHANSAELTLDAAVAEQVHAEILRHQGHYNAALDAYRQALESLKVQRQQELVREVKLGIVETYAELGEADLAAAHLQQLRRSRLPVYLRWRYDWTAGRISALHSKPDLALQAYFRALMEMRGARRTLEHEDQIEPFVLALQPLYEEAFGLAIERAQPMLALTFAELYGAQLLSVRMGRNIDPVHDPRELSEHVTSLLTGQIGKDWTILRYAWHQNDIWLFAITARGVQHYHIPLDPEQTSALQVCASPDDSFREFAYRGSSQNQRNASTLSLQARQQVLQALIPASIRERLSPDHLLIIVPVFKLHGLPFHALLDGATPLVETATVAYAYSLEQLHSSLAFGTERPSGLGTGLICGQSSFEESQYEPLPYVADEVEAIERTLSTPLNHLLEDHLNRTAIIELYRNGQLSQYDWLHFATHAYYDADTGAFTGLLLGQDRIELSDIYQWNLKARLVTLSACQTGLGKWYYGDEIVGLVQAFLCAGAQTIAASLWLGRDQQIPSLMAEFYSAMQRGQRPSFALAEAQRQAHRNSLDAYDWAPWAIFGHY